MVAAQRGAPRYYCSEASVVWSAARVGISTPALCPPSQSEMAGRPLECALWSLAAPVPSAGSGAPLLEMREQDGGWKAEPWVWGLQGAWESRPVTIAFVIAALQRLASS